jgi:hypothetical protein
MLLLCAARTHHAVVEIDVVLLLTWDCTRGWVGEGGREDGGVLWQLGGH